jgi:hypothetical protein
MPEVVGPATSGILQDTMREFFKDFGEWCIVIFDNILVCADDYPDLYEKVKKVLDKCIQHNIVLKFSKSFLGMESAKFFGYEVRYMEYGLTQERKDAILSIPFPTGQKMMQSFLGSALFFKSFVPNYSEAAALLHDMTRKEFPWKNPDTWEHDYKEVFEKMKQKLYNAMTLQYPDYDLEWILRVDASKFGVGAALFQVRINTDDTKTLCPIAFVSQKFSGPASRWTTIEQEAYACFFGIYKFAYYLRCKQFILETDHNNLIWIE